MWKRLWSRLSTPLGILGTALVTPGAFKIIGKAVALGGDVDFLAQWLPRLWAFLDNPIVLLSSLGLGVGLIIRALKSEPATTTIPATQPTSPLPILIGTPPSLELSEGTLFTNAFTLTAETPEQKTKKLEDKLLQAQKDCESYKERLITALTDLRRTQLGFANHRIFMAGCSVEVKELKVLIQFVDLDDADLAKRIEFLLKREPEDSPWLQIELQQIQWRECPSPEVRIILTSKEPAIAQELTIVFNLFDLIKEQVTTRSHNSVDFDLVITIFKKRKAK